MMTVPPIFKYKIDYEYGMAELFTWETDDPLNVFESLASECFGIRKSIRSNDTERMQFSRVENE